jgi:hypothetical protein
MAMTISKKKTTTLFTHLILFDFFFIDAHTNKNLLHFGSFPVRGVKKIIYLLSLFDQFKSFKQFFRLLQFLKTSKQKKSMNILISSDEHVSILQEMLKLRFQTQIISSFAKQQKVYKPLKMLLLLDYPAIRPLYAFNCVTRNNFNLVQGINSEFEINSLGNYKICNNFLNIKRLVFIGVLLKQILK